MLNVVQVDVVILEYGPLKVWQDCGAVVEKAGRIILTTPTV